MLPREAVSQETASRGRAREGGCEQVIHSFILRQHMQFRRLWTLLTMRSRYERLVRRDLKDALDRVHRLEIAMDHMLDNVEHLKARQERLGTRLGGALGGRPRVGSPGAPQRLEDIPAHDKAALRAWFAAHPLQRPLIDDKEH